jgi:hypothetical protein
MGEVLERLTLARAVRYLPWREIRVGGSRVRALTRFLGIFALVLSALSLGSAGPAAAANPLLCFDGPSDGTIYGGDCTLNASGTGAVLDNSGGDPDGSYSGVYFAVSSVSGKLLSEVSDLSFTYTGTATAGSPRISLPIDTNNDGATDFYAFIGAFYCNNGAGLVDPMHDTTCTIFFTGNISGDANWAAFVAAHPTWRVSNDVPFIIADDAGLWTVGNVHLGEAAKAATAKDECKKGGWEDMTRADGSSFKNQGDCIQYVNTGK